MIIRLAKAPCFKWPNLASSPINLAGVLVIAFNAVCGDKPAEMAFLTFGQNSVIFASPLDVIAKSTPAFSKAAKLPGAISQCFKSAKVNLWFS